MPSTDSSAAELQARADEITWFHRIELGAGVVTKGQTDRQISFEHLPEFSGRSVLDIGAWDGYYSFLAERQGATRVVALDHYAWGIDWGPRNEYWDRCRALGTLPDHTKDETEFWRPDLPGRRGFDFAKGALGSRVEPVLGDFAHVDLEALGEFDVVLYLGVLYHMKEPLTCLERVRRVTKHVAVVETAAVAVEGYEDESVVMFLPGDELNSDFGNWYAPNLKALGAMCLAAGFSSVTAVNGTPGGTGIQPYRAIVHAYV